jgi:hypothetical protein
MTIALPRFVIAKRSAAGAPAYYWNPPPYWRRQAEALGRRFPFASQPLGAGLSQTELDAAALPHNARFDEWRTGGGSFGTGKAPPIRRYAPPGSVAWLIETYLESEIFRRRVGERARPDYRRLFDQVLAIKSKAGIALGTYPIASVTPAMAEIVYGKMIEGERYRRGEKAVMYCKTAWRLMQPHYPREFRRDVPNPWVGVQLVGYQSQVKPAHDREAVYAFAAKAIELKQPELAAAAVICFEWLQRPENVLGGYVTWSGYVPGRTIRIEHHKTGAHVQHVLSETTAEGTMLFYGDAEAVLAGLPRRGVPMILRPDGTLYEPTRFAQLVRKVADAAGLPKTFSLDACRHGGMTELEEAELTDGQGRALSAHRSRAYEGYAKRTEKRVLAATRRRHAYLVANK